MSSESISTLPNVEGYNLFIGREIKGTSTFTPKLAKKTGNDIKIGLNLSTGKEGAIVVPYTKRRSVSGSEPNLRYLEGIVGKVWPIARETGVDVEPDIVEGNGYFKVILRTPSSDKGKSAVVTETARIAIAIDNYQGGGPAHFEDRTTTFPPVTGFTVFDSINEDTALLGRDMLKEKFPQGRAILLAAAVFAIPCK